jgi:hypothetical protein
VNRLSAWNVRVGATAAAGRYRSNGSFTHAPKVYPGSGERLFLAHCRLTMLRRSSQYLTDNTAKFSGYAPGFLVCADMYKSDPGALFFTPKRVRICRGAKLLKTLFIPAVCNSNLCRRLCSHKSIDVVRGHASADSF